MNQDPSFTGVKKASYSPQTTPRMNSGGPNMLHYNRADNTQLPQTRNDLPTDSSRSHQCCSKKAKIIAAVVAIAIVLVLVVVLPSTLVKTQNSEEHDEAALRSQFPGFTILRGNLTASVRRVNHQQRAQPSASDESFFQFVKSQLKNTDSPFRPTIATLITTLASNDGGRFDFQGPQFVNVTDRITNADGHGSGNEGHQLRKRQASPAAMAQFVHMLNESGLLPLATSLGLLNLSKSDTELSSASTPDLRTTIGTTVELSTEAVTLTASEAGFTTPAPIEDTGTTTISTTEQPSTAVIDDVAAATTTRPRFIIPVSLATTRISSSDMDSTSSASHDSITTETSTSGSTVVAEEISTPSSQPETTATDLSTTTLSFEQSASSSGHSLLQLNDKVLEDIDTSSVTTSHDLFNLFENTTSSTIAVIVANSTSIEMSSLSGDDTTAAFGTSFSPRPTLPVDNRNFTAEQHVAMEQLARMIMEATRDSQLCSLVICKSVEVEDFSVDGGNKFDMDFRIHMDADMLDVEFNKQKMDEIKAAIEHGVVQRFSTAYPEFQLENPAIVFDLGHFCLMSNASCNISGVSHEDNSRLDDNKNLLSSVHSFNSSSFADDVSAFNDSTLQNKTGNLTEAFTTTEISTVATTQYLPIFPNPPPVANCSDYGFLCSNLKQRVATRQRCDGELNCVDGSDEEFCRDCLTSIKCPINDEVWKCLRGDQLCDGVRDCPTGYDESEMFCRSQCIPGQQFKCKGSSVCIPLSFLCDGDRHCPHGDDEASCSAVTGCNNNAFLCSADNVCIPQWKRCDGVADCSDGSDENNCSCVECSGDNAVLCSAGKGRCIQRSSLCNNVFDCPNHEDEVNCPGWCDPQPPIETVICSDGKQYPKRYACAGYIDVCRGSCKECDPEIGFGCVADGTCIKRELVCDGIPNCSDGSDERPKICACFGPNNYTCKDERNHCISPDKVCDGFRDCLGGDDEANCPSCVNNPSGFYCGVKQRCYTSNHRCDGVVDCPDYSDEDNCTCSDCKSHYGYATFMCKNNNRCLHQSYVCNPKSAFNCPASPGQEPEDELFCPSLFVVGKQRR